MMTTSQRESLSVLAELMELVAGYSNWATHGTPGLHG